MIECDHSDSRSITMEDANPLGPKFSRYTSDYERVDERRPTDGIDNSLSFKPAGGSSSYTHRDHLGTPIASSTAAGVYSGSTTIPDSFGYGVGGFTGREYDSYLDLQYSRARMYDPKLGRFISEDPIGFAGVLNTTVGFLFEKC